MGDYVSVEIRESIGNTYWSSRIGQERATGAFVDKIGGVHFCSSSKISLHLSAV